MMRGMAEAWTARVDRAAELAAADSAASGMLRTYAQLLVLQRDVDRALRAQVNTITGRLEHDLDVVRPCAITTLAAITAHDEIPGDEESTRYEAEGPAGMDATLLDGWHACEPSFFARLVLQPYAECLAGLGRRPARNLQVTGTACPFCGGPPQLSILRAESSADGGGRLLQCAMCATTWPLRRLLCPGCGEEDERRLGYFRAPEFDHLRVDACETCRRYLKAVDLTRTGLAVPAVDEVAGASLDLWATNQGYRKIALNLMGL
jgi:hypothetical protein